MILTDGARVPLKDILPDADFAHRLTLRPADPARFFHVWDPTGSVLAERRKWIVAHPERHALSVPGAGSLIREAAELLSAWTATDVPSVLGELGARVEPDVILLAPVSEGLRMMAGAVCFPSSWAPEAKMGLGLREIHGVVPGLNPALAAPIERLLGGMQSPCLRANWGLASTSERNLHPARGLSGVGAAADPAGLWLRVEQQCLAPLPRTRGVLFGIRIECAPLAEVRADDPLRRGLRRALASMSPEMARYKGLEEVRSRVVKWLDDGTRG